MNEEENCPNCNEELEFNNLSLTKVDSGIFKCSCGFRKDEFGVISRRREQ